MVFFGRQKQKKPCQLDTALKRKVADYFEGENRLGNNLEIDYGKSTFKKMRAWSHLLNLLC